MSGVLNPVRKGFARINHTIFGDSKLGRLAASSGTNPFGGIMQRSDSASIDRLRDPLNLSGGPKEAAEERAKSDAQAIKAAQPPPLPLPDPDAIARERRKTDARRRSSGRSSTILSDSSYDALGG